MLIGADTPTSLVLVWSLAFRICKDNTGAKLIQTQVWQKLLFPIENIPKNVQIPFPRRRSGGRGGVHPPRLKKKILEIIGPSDPQECQHIYICTGSIKTSDSDATCLLGIA